MAEIDYRGYRVGLASYKLQSGEWWPKAVVILQGGEIPFSPIFSRKEWGFKTQKEANSCALKLAKVWIDHHLA